MNAHTLHTRLTLFLMAFLLTGAGFSQPSGRVQVSVDAARPLGTLEPFWASQIVHPTESLLTDAGRDFLQMLKETGAARQFVRIYNQPETAVRVAADGTLSYDWSRFDRMAGLILASGNRLKVVFFAMPFELAAYPESVKTRPNGAKFCISPPKDYKQWEALCADFTRHVVAKYGLEEVKQWTFRCWNEPDLPGFWHKADMREYLKLYDYFAAGVKGACPEIKIGGPALSSTNTFKDPKRFKLFLDHVDGGTNSATGGIGAPIDFLGVHTYGGSGGGGGPGRAFPDVEYMLEQQLRYADLRDAHPKLKGLPIHVEEWGETSGGTTGVSEKKPTADVRNSEYGAAFLANWVGRHLMMRRENDRNFESFTFCASGYEKPPERDFMGYRTLHTKSGFHKPILNAYTLLGKLAPELVKAETAPSGGHVSAFASRDADRVTVVVVNYQHDQIDSSKGVPSAVELKIETPWPSGTKVTVRHWRIDGSHSNAYTAFKAAGSPASPTPEQIAAIKKRMGLELLEPARQLTCEALSKLTFDLPCNAVSLLEVVRGE
jgi:xylan 1,4-beta-xylosidase